MLSEMMEAIRLMQRASPKIEVKSIAIDRKSREHLIFEMMKQDRQNPNPKPEMAARYMGVVQLLGVEINEGETP
jgi:hypothetical protein